MPEIEMHHTDFEASAAAVLFEPRAILTLPYTSCVPAAAVFISMHLSPIFAHVYVRVSIACVTDWRQFCPLLSLGHYFGHILHPLAFRAYVQYVVNAAYTFAVIAWVSAMYQSVI